MAHHPDPATEAERIIHRRRLRRSLWILLLALAIAAATRGLWEMNVPLVP